MNASPTLAERLLAVQQATAISRCEAFVDYEPTVAAEALQPITLHTYNALIAFRNAFVTGEAIAFEDIANFVWVHHPRFGQFNRKEKARVTRRIYRALQPTFPTLNAMAHVLVQFPRLGWLRSFVVPNESERITACIAEIRRLLHEATCDLPTSDREQGGEPMPFAFEAYVLNLFRRHLGMSFEETRRMPLKCLAQHLRELLYHASKGKALLVTPEEAEIWREHLARSGANAKHSE